MGGRPLLVAVLLAAGVSLADEPKSSRFQVTSDHQHVVRFTEAAEGSCRLEVMKDDQPVWQLEKCLATADDLFFVSNDLERVWVLFTLPEKPAMKVQQAARRPWYSATVAQLYDKAGELIATRKLSDFVGKKEHPQMRQLERRFKWLAGAAGEGGKGPRINDKNQVEFETLGSNRTATLSF